MHKQIFVNLPVKDLARSRAFFFRASVSNSTPSSATTKGPA
jgi:predicted lactoylglutathione lyase